MAFLKLGNCKKKQNIEIVREPKESEWRYFVHKKIG
jgi:hypothetical protein